MAPTTTTSNSYWQLEKEYYSLVNEHDLIVRVIEHECITRIQGEGDTAHTVTDRVPKKVHEFKTLRSALNRGSTFFAALFKGGQEGQANGDMIEISDEDLVESLALWLNILHNSNSDTNDRLNTSYRIELPAIWDLLAAAKKYGIDTKCVEATSWFATWWTANPVKPDGKNYNFKDFQVLLYPCYAFDHAEGFQMATRYLVYRSTGQIVEQRQPEGMSANVRDVEDMKLETAIVGKCFILG